MENTSSGVTQTAAGSEQAVSQQTGTVDKAQAFEQLIKGEYKQEYDARVQDTVRKRLGSAKQAQTLLEQLGQKYGLSTEDIAALVREQKPSAPGEQHTEAAKQYGIWSHQAQEAKKCYPGLDMGRELQNPRFGQLLQKGVDVTTAFEVVHKDELLPAAMQAAAKAVQERLASNLAATGARPAESAMTSASAALVKTDVMSMSKEDRAQIIRRVAQGERIRL